MQREPANSDSRALSATVQAKHGVNVVVCIEANGRSGRFALDPSSSWQLRDVAAVAADMVGCRRADVLAAVVGAVELRP